MLPIFGEPCFQYLGAHVSDFWGPMFAIFGVPCLRCQNPVLDGDWPGIMPHFLGPMLGIFWDPRWAFFATHVEHFRGPMFPTFGRPLLSFLEMKMRNIIRKLKRQYCFYISILSMSFFFMSWFWYLNPEPLFFDFFDKWEKNSHDERFSMRFCW